MTNNPADIIATSGDSVTVSPFGNARLAALLPPSKLSLIGRNMVPGVMARQARFVENLYEMLLGRAPDRAGLRRYVRLLQAGFSRAQVAAIFRADPTLLPMARFAPNQVLLKFKDGIAEADKARVRALVRATQVKRIQTEAMRAAGYGDLEVLRGPADVLAAVARLKRNPLVAFAEPNWVWSRQAIANDPYYANGSLWGMYSDDIPDAVGPPGTTNPYGSQAEKAWAAGYTGSRTVYVGIIDEGIQFTHPDLEANVWDNAYDTPGDGIDNDGNGYVDDVHGWDFLNRDNSIYDGAGDDHGTHVAGTIAAQGDNSIGVAGVNWKVTYISGKFLGPDGGYTTDAIRALDYMTDLKVRHGLNIVATNNSWGGGGFSQGLLDAITRGAKQNILFVAAAGNDGDNNDRVVTYPSNYNTTVGTGHDAVIAVAAIDKNGKLASFSNYGTTTVDLGAPGVGIYSTVPSGSYGAYSGTSMATPHVTGAAALYAASHPGATAAQIKTAILGSTQATDSLNGKTVTGGRLDLSALIGTTPAFSIDDVTQGEGDAGAANFTFTVTLSAASSQIVSVQFATADGTAAAGSDYTANSDKLTFAPGETSKTVAVSVNGDTTIESDETFVVNLSNAVKAAIANSQGIGTILDDDSLPLLAPLQFYVAAGKGRVKAFATDGALIRNFKPYGGYNGALRVATGDVNEDGVHDVIVAVDGRRPIRIFDGLTGQPMASFRAFGAGAVTGPLWIAAGDVNGDGHADIVVGKGNGPRVKVFNGAAVLTGAAALLSQLRPFAQATGGVRVATGLINNDAFADVIVARGPRSAPRVKVFGGGKPGALLASFNAYGVGTSGLFIAAGDFTGDGRDDVIVGRGPGYPGHVRVFNVNAVTPQVVYGFLAFGGKTDGVRVAAIDVNDDQVPDILATRGRNSLLRVFDGSNPAILLEAFAAFPGAIGGFFVAGTGVAGA